MKIKDVVVEGMFDYFTSSAVASTGYKEFTKLLRDNNINIENPGPAIAGKLPNYLQQWTINYMSGGERRQAQPAIIAKIQAIPIPVSINDATIRQYIKNATEARNAAKEEINTGLPTLSNNTPGQQTSSAPTQQTAAKPQTAPTKAPESAGGVTLVRTAGRDSGGQPTPTVVTYKKQQFALMDDGRWLNVINGKTVNTALASFLQTELESIS